MFAYAQLNTPACDKEIVALLHAPGPSVTLPRLRSWSLVRSNGLTLLAVTAAITVAARAGTAAVRRLTTNRLMRTSLATFRAKRSCPPDDGVTGSVEPKWLNFGQPCRRP